MNRAHRLDPVIHTSREAPARRLTGERGEGVISTAIAVLIVAFIGAAMWVAFNSIWTDTEANIQREVGTIGAGGSG